MSSIVNVNENGVVGQATSFNLTLTGDAPYTYTHTFGNICNVVINGNIATVSITPVETGEIRGSITFNGETTYNINIIVQGEYMIYPNTVIRLSGSQRCYTNIYDKGELIDYRTISNTRLIIDYVKNNVTGDIVATGRGDYHAYMVSTGELALYVKSGGSEGNIYFYPYPSCLPNGIYVVKFVYTDTDSVTHDLYVRLVVNVTETAPHGYSLTPAIIDETAIVGSEQEYTLTLNVGDDFNNVDIDYAGDVYSNVVVTGNATSEGVEIKVNYLPDSVDETESFTVMATCHRTGNLSNVVLSSDFMIYNSDL